MTMELVRSPQLASGLMLTGGVYVPSGNFAVGATQTFQPNMGILFQGTLSGSNYQYGILSIPTYSSATANAYAMFSRTTTAAASFTLANSYTLWIDSVALGAGSAITNQYGVYVNNQGGSGVANAYGIYVVAQTGATTTNVSIYNGGSQWNVGYICAGATNVGMSLGDIMANRGSSQGCYYFGGITTKYLFYDGTNFTLAGGQLTFQPAANQINTAAIQANAITGTGYFAYAPSYTNTTVNTWIVIAPLNSVYTCNGGVVIVTITLNFYHSVANALHYVAVAMDGNPQVYEIVNSGGTVANNYTSVTMQWQSTPSAGNHTFSVAIYMGTTGTFTLSTGSHSIVSIVEIKR